MSPSAPTPISIYDTVAAFSKESFASEPVDELLQLEAFDHSACTLPGAVLNGAQFGISL
jgi:hypothetical protein